MSTDASRPPADVLAELVEDTVRRARNLTPRAWREVTSQAGQPRREVALDLAAAWVRHAETMEGAGGPRSLPTPAHDYAIADVLAVTGADLVAAVRSGTVEDARAVVSETDDHRWRLLGAPPPERPQE